MKKVMSILVLAVALVTSAWAGANQTASKQLTINVVSQLSITTTSLPSAFIGAVYSATLTATGGTTPYTWSVTTGVLPPGLALSGSTGIIGGTPTAQCAVNPCAITFTVTDSSGSVSKLEVVWPGKALAR